MGSGAFRIAVLGMVGCADAIQDETLDEQESPLLDPNLLDPNALDPNALDPNALDPNALDPNALDPNALDPNGLPLITTTMKSLKRADLAGTRSRALMQYMVECAYAPSTPRFTFSWVDSASVTHNESWPATGRPAMGLAPTWRTSALTAAGKQWITACVASRVNATGTSIMLSSRGSHAALTVSAQEKNDYTQAEGTFWGNSFDTSDAWYACEASKACRLDVANSTYQNRVCANADPTKCGPITKLGYCGDVCETYVPDPGYWTNCHKGVKSISGVWPDAANPNTISAWLAKPAHASDTCKVIQIASNPGSYHSCALRGTGELACWGRNDYGQLGSDTRSPRSLVVVAVPSAVEVGTSFRHSCLRKSGGTVNCWGDNQNGQLGIGTIDSSVYNHPPGGPDVTNLTDAVEIDAGQDHTCARRATGAVVCWGDNYYGQLGDGTFTRSGTPRTVSGLTDAVEVDVGAGRGCARRAGGTVVCWGGDHYGGPQTPVTVTGLTDAVEIASAGAHHCARRATGAVVCWGGNNYGQLGNGTFTDSATPVTVSGVTDAVEIAAGSFHSCARRATGAVVCWGENFYGQLGDGTFTTVSPYGKATPVTVSGLTDAVGMSLGTWHSCARTVAGRLMCWGDNQYRQLGDTTTTNRSISTHVNGTGQLPPLTYSDFAAGSIGAAWTLVGGTWSQAGGVLAQTSTAVGNPKVATLTDKSYPANLEITAKVRVNAWSAGDSARAGVVLNADASGRGYGLVFHNATTTVQFLNDGTTPVWGNSYSFTWTIGKWYWFKLQLVNGVLKGRVWADDQKEPTSWTYTQTGWTSHASGRPGLHGGASGTGSSTVSFDNAVVR